MDRQLTVHQGDVQASAHVVFHRTHDPEEKEEKQNTTVGPECGVNTLELCEGPHGVMPKHQETHGIIWAICFLLETSGGLDYLRSLSWHVWTRRVCPGKREGPCPGLGGAGGMSAHVPRLGGRQSLESCSRPAMSGIPKWSPAVFLRPSIHTPSSGILGKTVLLRLRPGGSQH